jgi:hypothetical protein
MEKVKCWIARDGKQDGKNDHELYQYDDKPEYDDQYNCWNGESYRSIDGDLYPEVKNGECAGAEIVLSALNNREEKE